MAYPIHPAADYLPRMTDEEFSLLKQGIERDGLLNPIVLCDNQVLDGRHRYRACAELGIEPTYIQFVGGNPFDYVREQNVNRRHFASQEQKYLVLLRLTEASETWADERARIQREANAKRAEAAKGNDNAAKVKNSGGTDCAATVSEPKSPKPDSRPGQIAVAAAAGVNRGAVQRGEYLAKAAPELAAAVAMGEVSASAAIRQVRSESIRRELDEVAARAPQSIDGTFDVLVIDPPWPMEKIERDARPNQVAFGYPTMSRDELLSWSMPSEKAAEDAHVFVWTTHRFLPLALECVEAWGFRYVLTMVWHKPGGFQPVGLPQFNCEFAIYARKGSPSFVDTKAFPTCFSAERGAHSEKPEEFYELLRRVTAGRRLDLFNRRIIDGFIGWGNEAAA